MEELKPCPFCGGKAVKIVYWDEEEQNEKVWEHGVKQDENHYYVIHCYDCDIELFGGVPISGEELIKAWNRRAEMTNRFNALCGQEESDHKFLVEIIAQICDYAVDNDMKPNDTIMIIANNMLMLTEIANYDNWKRRTNNDN